MSLATDVTLTNNDNSKVLLLRGVRQWKDGRSQPAMAFPIVNATPANNVLFRFTGQTDDVSFQAILIDDGTDVANSSHSTTVTTLSEQIAYIKDYIYTEDFDVDWTLIQEVSLPSPGIKGVLTQCYVERQAGAPTFAFLNVQFKRGRIGIL